MIKNDLGKEKKRVGGTPINRWRQAVNILANLSEISEDVLNPSCHTSSKNCKSAKKWHGLDTCQDF